MKTQACYIFAAVTHKSNQVYLSCIMKNCDLYIAKILYANILLLVLLLWGSHHLTGKTEDRPSITGKTEDRRSETSQNN